MPSKLTNTSMPHTAGLSGDRTLDGVAIGTLVAVVDRAKNLPNLRSMGKQDPYCALRLGKEAKKTETDKRGGQTPRWYVAACAIKSRVLLTIDRDQELRFTVYESTDYQKIKCSVFNDDRRTDLIGESWIDLDSILQHGGGQMDAWHDLNVKGRYAGQVRIELTFYDTRPREEFEPEPIEDSGEVQEERTPGLAGPRQPPVKRRPLPGTGDMSAARHHSESDVMHLAAGYDQHDFAYPPRPGLPDHSMSAPVLDHGLDHDRQLQSFDDDATGHADYHELDDDLYSDTAMSYTDDPQAFEAVHAGGEAYIPAPIAPLRCDKISPRPPPPTAPPHSHSSPDLAFAHQKLGPRGSASTTLLRHGFDEGGHDLSTPHPYAEFDQPPPPPSHRNSSPSVPRTPQRSSPLQVSPGQSRALHHATSSHDLVSDTASSVYGYDGAPQAEHTDRRRSADPASLHDRQVQPTRSTPHGPVREGNINTTATPSPARVQALNPSANSQAQSFDTTASSRNRQQPLVSTSAGAVPLYKPRAISPNADPRQTTHSSSRKPVGSSPAPAAPLVEEQQTKTAPEMFSPDSFDHFNPHMSKPAASSAPASPFDDHKSAQPMYKSQNGSNTTLTRPSSSGIAAKEEPKKDSFGRIIRADGRRVDPSDHLPSSTYAPEPEPKGSDREKRLNIKVNLKSRFGPREALHATTTPIPPANTAPPVASTFPRTMADGLEPARDAPSTLSIGNSPVARPTPPRSVISGTATLRYTQPAPLHTTPPHSNMSSIRQAMPPRDSPPAPAPVPNASPLQALEKTSRNRLQKRTPSGSSPLAPTAPNALNAGYHNRNQSMPALPPPVPGKVPLDAPDYPTQPQSLDGGYDDDFDYENSPFPPSHGLPTPPQPLKPMPYTMPSRPHQSTQRASLPPQPRHPPQRGHYPPNPHQAPVPASLPQLPQKHLGRPLSHQPAPQHHKPTAPPSHFPHQQPPPISQPPPSVPAIPETQPRRHGAKGYQIAPGTGAPTTLSHEISQIDLGPSPSREFQRVVGEDEGKRFGGLGGRLRRSRWGA